MNEKKKNGRQKKNTRTWMSANQRATRDGLDNVVKGTIIYLVPDLGSLQWTKKPTVRANLNVYLGLLRESTGCKHIDTNTHET